MTSRNVETRVVRLEVRSRIGRMSRLSRDAILAGVGDIYGEHSVVVSALAAIDPTAAYRLNALHQAGKLQP